MEKEFLKTSTIEKYYPICFRTQDYDKLFAIQTIPDLKIWYKDKEVSQEEMIDILLAKEK